MPAHETKSWSLTCDVCGEHLTAQQGDVPAKWMYVASYPVWSENTPKKLLFCPECTDKVRKITAKL